jgi:tetratricopeptide (TPR) repeat protein
MAHRFERLLGLLRRLLLTAFYAAGVLYFWLPSHEVFEGPKVQGSLIYGLLLALAAWPLLAARLPLLWQTQRQALQAGAALLAATLLSLVGALAALPGNTALALEHTAPVLASALAALVFWLEDREVRRRVLFGWLSAHCLLLFYGLVQVLDQNWGASHGVVVDLIRWTQFGQSRVYSSMGNPDYMAAHLTLLLPLWLGLGWRRLDARGPAQVAALALLGIPLLLLPALFGAGPMLSAFVRVMAPWTLLSTALFLAARRAGAKACWLALLGLTGLLIVLAQGRGAYLALGASLAAMAGAAWLLHGKAWFRDRWATLKAPAALLGLVVAGLLGLLLARASAPEAAWLKKPLPASALRTTDSLISRVVHIFDRGNDAQQVRLFYWKAAWRMGLEHPLLGVGFGNHALFTARAQSGVWKAMEARGDPSVALVDPHVELYTHNDLLQNWAETGALGLAAFLFFWWVFFRRAWRGARNDYHLGLLGLGVAFMVNAQVNFPWRVEATQQLCWLAFALLFTGKEAAPGTAADAKPGPWLWGAVAVFILALYPARWFFASNLFKQGNVRKDSQQVSAIPFYEKAVKAGLSGTQQVELYLYLGSMYNVAQRPDKAVEWFQRGVDIYPDFLEALYNLGYTYQLTGDTARAQAAFEHVLDVNPRYTSALNNLGNIHFTAKRYEQALVLYQRLARFNPGMVEGHYNLGATYLMMGDAKNSLASFEQALKVKPDYAAARQYAEQLRRLPPGTVLKRQ